MPEDVRWKQRFQNFCKELSNLEAALSITNPSSLEKTGAIKHFEMTAELAWNTMKDYLEEQGEKDMTGSYDAIKTAFKNGLIKDGESWIRMIKSRNLTSHLYNEPLSDDILQDIRTGYLSLFRQLKATLQSKMQG